MTFFGHLGLATLPIQKLFPELRFVNIALGTIGPDILDKALYYGAVVFFPKGHFVFEWIPGSRTIGHSGILAVLLLAISLINRRVAWVGFSMGWVSHLILDFYDQGIAHLNRQSLAVTLLYPFGSEYTRALRMPYPDLEHHLSARFGTWKGLLPEILGAIFLGFTYWKFKKEAKHEKT